MTYMQQLLLLKMNLLLFKSPLQYPCFEIEENIPLRMDSRLYFIATDGERPLRQLMIFFLLSKRS